MSRLKQFVVAPGVDVQAVAAADMGEAQVQAVRAHRGMARTRKELEFEILWADGDITWEPWERVKKLTAVEDYIRENPGKAFCYLVRNKPVVDTLPDLGEVLRTHPEVN